MAYFELDDVFTYQDANDIKKLWAAAVAPTDPGTGEVWLDTSVTPNKLKRNNGTGWDTIGDMTAADVLNAIKTVDGNGSGLDADLLDGKDGTDYIQYDSSGNVGIGTSTPDYRLEVENTGTSAQIVANRTDGSTALLSATGTNGFVGTLSNHDLRLTTNNTVKMTVDTDGNVGIGTTSPESKLDIYGDVTVRGALTGSAGSHANHPVLQIRQTEDASYDIGDIHGELEFYTDDPDGIFPGSQAFIRAVTTSGNGNSNPDAGLSFGVSDSSGTGQEVMQLTGDGELRLLKDSAIRVGANWDLVLKHDGTHCYLQNNTNNGSDLYIQNKSNGENINMTCLDDSGTEKSLLILDPDESCIQAGGAIISKMYPSQTIANNEIFDTGIARHSVGFIWLHNITTGGNTNGAQFTIGMNTFNNNGVIQTGGTTTYYSANKDSNQLNVYAESTGNVKIQNISGSSVTLDIGFTGVEIS